MEQISLYIHINYKISKINIVYLVKILLETLFNPAMVNDPDSKAYIAYYLF